MSKIIISNLSFSYKEYYQPIFTNVNLSIDTSWKLGLIGRNGRGKSTLLRLLHGEIEPDSGRIVKDVITEYFPYTVNSSYQNTLEVMKENIGGLQTMENRMEEILKELGSLSEEQTGYTEQFEQNERFEKKEQSEQKEQPEQKEQSEQKELLDTEENPELKKQLILTEYQQLLADYMDLDGFFVESSIRKEMNLMQLPERLLEQDYELLSGGEKTKLQIITLFLRKNSFVLLDEPTNHLDLEGKRILADYLQRKQGFLIVSHDRRFLDEVIDHVISINKAGILLEKGNYSSWRKNKEMMEEFELRTKERLEREVEALEKVSLRTRSWASIAEKEKNPFATNNRGNSSRAAKFMRQAKTAEQNIRDNLQEKKNLLKNYEVTADMILKQQEVRAESLVSAYDLSFGYGEELLFEQVSFCINPGDRIWIRGQNGAGKSTLLKLISGQIPSERILRTEGIHMETAFQEPLWSSGYLQDLLPEDERRSIFMDICHRLDVNYEVLKRPLETFSSGELKKIDIARALASPCHLLLMDEPLNFMDIYFREQLEKAILKYQPTIIFVEHDEQFGSNVATGEILLA